MCYYSNLCTRINLRASKILGGDPQTPCWGDTAEVELRRETRHEETPRAEITTPGAEEGTTSAETRTPGAEEETPGVETRTPEAETPGPGTEPLKLR